MPEAIRRVEYYYVTVADRPGEGAEVLASLKDAGVNLLAYHGFPSGRARSQIDLVPDDPAALKRAAAKAGLKLSLPKRAFLIQGEDRVGAVADIASKLAQARVNITAASASCAGGGRYGMILWVGARDYAKAAKALGV